MVRFPCHLVFSLAVLVIAACGARAAEPPRIVASILPLHGLAAAVTEGVTEPSLLVPPGSSPHTFQLRPSDAERLEGADLVVWVGEALETFLVKPLRTLGAKPRILAVSELPGVTLLPVREGGVWAKHRHDHGHEHERARRGGKEHAIDGHLWLDPENGIAIVRALAGILAERDPERAAIYRANAQQEVRRIEALDRELAAKLAAVKDTPFLVFHDAYQYFEKRYGLSAVGSITVAPDRQPSAKRLAQLRKTIQERRAVCVFAEPQFRAAVIASVVEGTGARTGVLDPEGAPPLRPGPAAYRTLLRNLGEDLLRCLAPGA